MHVGICGSVVPEPRQKCRGKVPSVLTHFERKPSRTALLIAAAIFSVGGSFTPAFSFGAAGDSSWSFYGNYDYSQNGDAGDTEPTQSPGTDWEQERQGQRDESGIEQREKLKQTTQPESEHSFDSYDVNDPKYSEYLAKFTYVLYYGGFDSRVADAILAAEPTLLITNYHAIGSEMRNEFARNNITVIAYLPIDWTDRPLDSTLEEARRLLDDGADGLFIDEAATISSDWEFWYHGRIYETAKQFDKDSVVVINPGSASITERSMQVADIICFEHEWRDIANLSWASDYPGWRFMGISSNEFVKVMGYHVGSGSARDDLDEARSLNVAYHYSADHYIWLPPWLDVYGGVATAIHPVGDYVDLDLNEAPRSPPDETERPSSQLAMPEEKATPDTAQDANDTSAEPEKPVDIPEGPESGENADTNKSPRARAGNDQSVVVSKSPVTVHLDGRESSDPDSEDRLLSFSWKQTGGPDVELSEEDSAASFIIDPSIFAESDIRLGFELTVSDTDGAEDTDSVVVVASIKEESAGEAESRDIGNTTDAQAKSTEGDQDEEVEPPKNIPNESNSTKTATEASISSKVGSKSDNSTTELS